ncbi:MAG: YihA family ribosome biogenesis GTP-binding protein [Bacteroidetes bacterium]|nr:YihA family ribosome biogenesis GTP-binding protein [Bacteroidota bacterium]
MEIRKADFLGSWEKTEGMPHTDMPEFAFIGRSNVGKSSLINMLTGKKGLAKTSQMPGKTQMLNLFKLNGQFQFCDLPGYGYAKTSKTQKAKFQRMIAYYLQKRPNLVCLFVLVDLRLPPQEIDMDFINDCGLNQIPIALIGTKADKIGKTAVLNHAQAIVDKLLESWEELPPFFLSSSETKDGKEDILLYIQQILETLSHA